MASLLILTSLSVTRWSGTFDDLSVIQALSSWQAHLMHLIRCLFFLEAHFGFYHISKLIKGKDNVAVDALSRDQLAEYYSLFPAAPRMPQC